MEEQTSGAMEIREMITPGERRFDRARRTVGLFAGPLAFFLLLALPPSGLSLPAARLAAVLAWVILWWITEAVPLPVTALLGPALGVICGVGKAAEMFSPFGDPIIFLFLGSFLLAEAMSSSGLDKRFARAILSRRWVGASPVRVMMAFGVIVALLSMGLSNTATAAMMYPIALGVIGALQKRFDWEGDLYRRYGTSLMLTVAYSASIGGVVTPVGTPPNLIALGQLDALAGIRLTFVQWMVIAAPVALTMMVVLFLIMGRRLTPKALGAPAKGDILIHKGALSASLSRAERNALVAFAVAVVLWLLPGILGLSLGAKDPLYRLIRDHLPEAVVALLAALLLFVLPLSWRERRFTLTWRQATTIDWGTLLLFGGGLSLGGAMFRTGLASSLGDGLLDLTGADSLGALTTLFAVIAVMVTEITSNTASATMLCPLAIAAAGALGVSPVPPVIATALGCSTSFMLPVSTPPNAIVYGSGCVPITSMLRCGICLDLACFIIVPGGVLLMCWALGI